MKKVSEYALACARAAAQTIRWMSIITAVAYPIYAQAASVFNVSGPAIVQQMVIGSSQQLYYNLSTSSSATVYVNCSVTLDDAVNTSYSFNSAGCLAAGGVAINSSIAPSSNPIANLLTLTVNADAPQKTYTGTVTFKTVGGQAFSKSFPFSFATAANSNRTITFKNYCKSTDAPQGVAIGLTTSNIPAKSSSSSSVTCSTNADCASFGYSNCQANGTCGYGACNSDSDCTNSTPGTCQLLIKSTGYNCTYCASNTDCVGGAEGASVCNTTTNRCYWAVPTPANNTTPSPNSPYYLGPYDPNTMGLTPYSATISIPDNSADTGSTLIWGGGFSGRTGCTYVSGSPGYYNCATADCNSGVAGLSNGACVLSQGFATPFTAPEITLVAYGPDTYDTSIINGINIPIAITPTNAYASSYYNNPYICGSAGGISDTVTSAGTIGGCSWDFVLPSGATNLAYQWIQTAGIACSSNSTCNTTSGEVCGVTRTQVTSGTGDATTHCGQLLGYFTLDEICTLNGSYNTALVNCGSTTKYGANTISQLALCTGPAGTSCYSVGSQTTTCGGCTNWNTQSWNGSTIKVPAPSSGLVPNCAYPNSNWVSGDSSTFFGILPTLTWLKAACPSVYVYAYDDVTATFTCPGNAGQLGTDYTVEFCPQNKLEPA